MENRVGQQLGNYRLIQHIADGGFAEVYLGEQIHLGTRAAIKILHAQLNSQDEQKFREEARTIAHLIHPNIVRVLDFGVEANTPFLVMDYAPNGTLQARHPPGKLLPLNIVVTYAKQIADALQYAHNARLIHRDVKPENLLVGQHNEVLLSDFGIAVVAHSTNSQVLEDKIGSILYMAPEQINGYPLPSSDQYALGIIVYQWLTGSPPFVGENHEIMAKHLHIPPPSLRAKIPTLPPLVEQIVLTALQKDSKQRFSSIQAFAYALEQAYLQFVHPSTPGGQKILHSRGQPVVSPRSPIPPTIPVVPLLPPVPTRRVGTLICKREGAYQSIARSPDSKRIASVHTDSVEVWDAMTASTVSSYKHKSKIAHIAWSPDSNYIASVADNQVVVWNADTAKEIATYDHAGKVTQIVWSLDGKWLASASNDKTIQIRVPDTGKLEFTYTGHFASVTRVIWAFDSRMIASISSDNSIHVCDMLTGYTIKPYNDMLMANWSSDRTRLAIAGIAGIQVIDISAMLPVATANFNEQVRDFQHLT